MLVILSDQNPKKPMYLPNWKRIWLQVISGSIRIGANQQEVQQQTGALFDGIVFDQNNANPFVDWWVGELWVTSITPAASFIVVTPGKDKRNVQIV